MWRAISMRAGVTCFVLRYRLPGEGWANRSDVPLQDAQRAMRLVRANAAKYGIDPARIGFMGFSAGGHVACSIATRFAAKVYDAGGCRRQRRAPGPLFGADVSGGHHGRGLRIRARATSCWGSNPSPELIDAYSCEKHVPADAPPTFLALAADDTTVPPMPNAGAYYAALQAAKIPAEMHMSSRRAATASASPARVGKPDVCLAGPAAALGREPRLTSKSALGGASRCRCTTIQRLAQHTLMPASWRGACSLRWRRNSRAPGRPL